MLAEEVESGRNVARPVATFGQCCAWLTLAIGLFSLPVGWFAYSQYGQDGLLSTAIAAGVCWLGAALALGAIAKFTGPAAVNGVLLGILFPTGLALAAAIVLNGVPVLAKAGIMNLILAYYLFTLVVKVWLSLRLVPVNPIAPGRSTAAAATGAIGATGSAGGQKIKAS